MKAYHFLCSNWTAGMGYEPPWTIGEERVLKGRIARCKRGYHYGRDWLAALSYSPGPVACVVDVDKGSLDSTGKGVSHRRKLVTGADCSRELRLYACDCAKRALTRERNAGREPDMRYWAAIKVARRFANGKASLRHLVAASDTAHAGLTEVSSIASLFAANAAEATTMFSAVLAAYVTGANAIDAACTAAGTWGAAAKTAKVTEREWQRQHLAELLDARLAEVGPMEAQDA